MRIPDLLSLQILYLFVMVMTELVISTDVNITDLQTKSSVKPLSDTLQVDATEDPMPEQDDQSTGRKVSEILDSLVKDYDKRIRPNYGGVPVSVGLTMYILAIHSLSEITMEFSVDMYFRQLWNDPRLKFNGPPGVKTITAGSEFSDSIWTPDTFIVNEKKSDGDFSFGNVLVRLSENGDVLRSARISLTASCPMDLRYFPMDRQLCTLEVESFGYTTSDIRYEWGKGADSVGISSDVSLPQLRVLGHRQDSFEISLTSGNYSRLSCDVQFARSVGYFVIQVYFPAGIIVIISMTVFWLSRTATGERVGLGVSTVLTITLLWTSVNSALPQISYVKALDVYLGTCFVMVFAALMEASFVGYISKHGSFCGNCKARETESLASGQPEPKHEGGKCCVKIAMLIDMVCRAGFPLLFLIFNIEYWKYYLYVSNFSAPDLILLNPDN